MTASRRAFAFGLVFVSFLAATNRWPGWDAGIELVQALDARAYELLAQAAPGLPTGGVAFHHEQRLALPWVLGVLMRATGLSLASLYFGAAMALVVAILACLSRVFADAKLDTRSTLVCWAVFFLNPYTLRYYLIVPGMSQDLLYVAGLSIACLGLVRAQSFLVWVGLAAAALGRQTELLILPGVLLWIGRGESWASQPRKRRLALAAALVVTSFGIYWAMGQLARMSIPTGGVLPSPFQVFKWMSAPGFEASALVIHAVRIATPYLAFAGLMLGLLAGLPAEQRRQLPWWQLASCLLALAATVAQPFLAGGEIVGANASRLSSLGLVFAACMLAMVLPVVAAPGRRTTLAAVATLAIASLHHLYASLGLPGAAWLVGAQAVTGAILFLLAWRRPLWVA